MSKADVRSRSVLPSSDNLWMRSDAGPWFSREFLSAYISGYVDGEGCFTVSISPRAKLLAGWEVRPSLSVSQNGDRAEVLHAIQAHFGCGSIRPDRSDKTLKWETPTRGHSRSGDPSLRVLPVAVREEIGLRALRRCLQVDGGRSTSKPVGPSRDRRARSDDESERYTAIRRWSDTRESASG